MKQMQRDPLASSKARKAERKADEKSGLITIKPVKIDMAPAASTGSGFKRGGFKNAFGGDEVKKEDVEEAVVLGVRGSAEVKAGEDQDGLVRREPVENDTDDEYEHYDPRRPTGCFEGCASR